MAITGKRPFRVDGIPIPTPWTYKFSVEDLSSENTGRTLDGQMHKDVVSIKDTYACTWKRLSWEDAATLMNAVDGKTRVRFTHADPRVPNRMVTGDFYIGKRECDARNLKDSDRHWTEINMTFIRI